MALHPQIRKTLEAFLKRRKKLLLGRILLSSGALLLGFGLLFGLFDWAFLLPDPLRFGLSATLYLIVLLNLFYRGILPWFAPSDPRSLARQIESANPTPHQGFLAAVELGLDTQPEALDSAEFRARIQDLGAAHGTESLVQNSLPWRRIRADLFAALGAALALISLLLATRGTFSIPLLRTLAPAANIERFSRFQITLLQPNAPGGVVPLDEKLTIEVSVTGPSAPSPTLEWIGPEGRSSHPMIPGESGRFLAQVPVGTQPAHFRIRAGDALTRAFEVHPTPRPAAVRFEKTVQPPVYSGIPTSTVSETHGNLHALFGSSAALQIELNQEVTSAALILHRGDRTESIPLPITSRTQSLHHPLPIDDSLTYHLELVSAQTGFSSLPAPQHEIRAETDLPPSITLESPLQDLSLRLGQTVDVHLQAVDDLGLVQVRQKLQINGVLWKDLPAKTVSEKTLELRQKWDPLQHGAKPGDILLTKFIAMDSLGQIAESRTVRITLLQADADPKRARDLALSRQVQEQLQSLQKESREAATALAEFRSQTDSQSPDLIRRDQSAVTAQRAVGDALQKAAETRLTLAQALRENSDPNAENALRDLSHLLNRIQFSQLETARDSLQESMDPATSLAADRKEAVRVALESISKAATQSALAHEAYKPQLAALEAASAAGNAKTLAAEQRAIVEQSAWTPPPSDTPKPTDNEDKRRQQINEAAVRALQKDLGDLNEHVASDRAIREPLKATRDDLQKQRIQIEKTLVMDDVSPAAKQSAQSLAESLERTQASLESLAPALEKSAEKARETLAKARESSADQIDKLAQQLAALAKRPDLSPSTKQSQIALRTAAEAAAVQAEATLESSLEGSKAPWAADLNTAARAMRAASAQPQTPEADAQKISNLGKMLRPLESAARIEETIQKAAALAKEATLEPPTAETAELNRSLDTLSRTARNSGLPPETQSQLQKTLESDPANRLRTKTPPAPDSPSSSEDAAILNQQLQETMGSAKAALTEARQSLEKSAPSAAEEFKRLAAEASLAGEKNSQLAQTLPNPAAPAPPTPETPTPEANQTSQPDLSDPARAVSDAQKRESRQSHQLAGARESLLQEANQQNLLSEEGRQRARDADAANALLKDAEKASDSLQKASETRDADLQSNLVKEAASQQKQTAQQLAKIAEHLENLEKGDSEKIARSRKALREAEKEAGLAKSLEAAQKRSEELSQLANATADEARKKLEELLQNSNSDPNSANKPQPNSAGKPGSRETGALQKALDSLKNSPDSAKELPSSTASSLAEAAKANQDAQRNNRLQKSTRDSANGSGDQAAATMDGEAQDGPGLDNLPTLQRSPSSDWGKLPKRLAKDLLEGKREAPSGEYQAAIESYFRAIAEKARGSAK